MNDVIGLGSEDIEYTREERRREGRRKKGERIRGKGRGKEGR